MQQSLTIIIAICLYGCAAQQKLLRIDLSGKNYLQTQIALSDIASVEYVSLRGSNGLSNDRGLELHYGECHSVGVTSGNIFVLRRGNGLHAIEKKPYLENAVYGFNCKGDFVGKFQSDTVLNRAYSYMGVPNSGRVCVRNTSIFDYHILNKKDMTIKSTNNFKSTTWEKGAIGGHNLHFLNDRLVLSFSNSTYYLTALGSEKIKRQPLYAAADWLYFCINGSYPEPVYGFYRVPLYPYAVKTKGGYMLPAPLTDTIRFMSNTGRLSDYIVNTKPRFSATDKVRSLKECRECNPNTKSGESPSLGSMDKAMVHRNCAYGDSVLRVMWPTIETKKYIFFTEASKREVIKNLPARYFVYKKREGCMYALKQEKLPLASIPLAYGECIFKERNLTTSPNIAVEYIPYQYLKSNESLLPKELKQHFGQLTDQDSGVLMIIKYK